MLNQDQKGKDPYLANQSTIQEILYRSLDKPDFPLQAKLFSLACFAHEMHPFFHLGTGNFEVERMAAVVDKLSAHRFEQTWMEQMGEQDVDLELPMSIVLSLLMQAYQGADKDMQHMLPLVWEQYFDSGEETNPFMHVDEDTNMMTIKCARAAESYARQRDRLWAMFSQEIEGYIQNYCTHFVFAKSYVQAESLPEYVQEMLIRVMVLKFLLVSHPGVQEVVDLAEEAKGAEEKAGDLLQSLDSQVMRIMKTFSNNVPNQHGAVDAVLREMQEQGMHELAHMAVMIHF